MDITARLVVNWAVTVEESRNRMRRLILALKTASATKQKDF